MKKESKTNRESYYFSHDYGARNDPKILELRAEYGLEGLGLYWCIVETLAEADDGYINPKLLAGLSIGYGVSKAKLQEYICFMIHVDLLREDENGYYSKRMMEHKQIRKKLSDAGKKGAKSRWGNRVANEDAKAGVRGGHNTPNAKERKGKEKKGNSMVDTNVSMLHAAHTTQDKINYEAIINFFNDETKGAFGRVMYPISKKRKEGIRARINEFGKDKFAEMIRKASKSDFLKGDSSNGFVAKFDWMIRPCNFQKIIEGNYDNKNKGYSGSAEASDEELMLHIRQGIARGIEENAIYQ